jgi:signal transduction histidine kinase
MLFGTIRDELIRLEKVRIIVEDEKVFNVFIPFTPNGEFQGVLYMKIVPDLSSISHDFIGSYNNVSFVYVFLVTAGLLIIYIVFSLTLRAKESAQQLASQEHEKFLMEKIEREKENTFTRRIYHAYHKAEKIVGFINMDLELIKRNNSDEARDRVQKYSNFIGRVIYDMKYYEPPVHSIINPIFRTNLNEVCRFVIDQLFLRIWKSSGMFEFCQDYALDIPVIHVNEYIIWEIIEPIIQNSIAHNPDKKIIVTLKTRFVKEENKILLSISDNGKGIAPELLEPDENGIQKLFLENVSTRKSLERQFGYGCYIAYSLAEKHCGWKMSARNLKSAGCEYTIEISINQG